MYCQEVFPTNHYEIQARRFKAVSDPNRLKIVEILSCGERCACDIQSFFDFTQPTLSHHMKLLMESGLVACRKEGVWTHYRLNAENAQDLITYFSRLTADTDDCLCRELPEQKACSKKTDKMKETKGASDEK